MTVRGVRGAAIWDLSRAGLPDHTHAIVVSASEPLLDPVFGDTAFFAVPVDNSAPDESATTIAQAAMNEAQHLTQEGASWVRDRCPEWIVDQEASEESPAHAILSAAAAHNADLIVVGSRGRSKLRRLLVGSVSQEVMRSAQCSVRCVHEHAEHARGPLRLILAFDPSQQMSQALVKEVAARRWPAGTTLCLLTVTAQQRALVTAGGPVSSDEWDAADAAALGMLGAAGYRAEHIARQGDATRLILEEAQEWGADCIFTTPGAFAPSRTHKRQPGGARHLRRRSVQCGSDPWTQYSLKYAEGRTT